VIVYRRSVEPNADRGKREPGDKEMMRKGLAIIVTLFLVTIWSGASFVFGQDEKPLVKGGGKNQYQLLEGKWVRPDGGYVLQLRNVESNGALKASYYNPKSINVGTSNWKADDGNLTVFVELRDINYQGSTYTLQYDPASDRLKGKYFQAPTGMTYEVEFYRVK
jgi:hypothetical protein